MHGRWSTWILQSNFASPDWPMTSMKPMHWTPLRPDAPWPERGLVWAVAGLRVPEVGPFTKTWPNKTSRGSFRRIFWVVSTKKAGGWFLVGCFRKTGAERWIAGLQMAVFVVYVFFLLGCGDSGSLKSKVCLLGNRVCWKKLCGL